MGDTACYYYNREWDKCSYYYPYISYLRPTPENKAASAPTSIPKKEKDTTTHSITAHLDDLVLSPRLADSCNTSWQYPSHSAPRSLFPYEEVTENDISEKQKSNDIDENLSQRNLMEELWALQLNGFLNKEIDCFSYQSPTEPHDRYGGKAKEEYPTFFRQIPQKPHYQGLIQEGVPEAIKEIVYSSLWFGLVELMRKALETTCFTSEKDIDELMGQARGLENLGFDVRHVIARLKQPAIYRAEADHAKKELEELKKRKSEVEDRVKEIKRKEDELRELRKAMGLVKHSAPIAYPREWIPNPDEDALQMLNLEVHNAEYLAQEKEYKVRSFGLRL